VETCQKYPEKIFTASKMISLTILTNRAGEKDRGFHLLQTQAGKSVLFFTEKVASKPKKPAG